MKSRESEEYTQTPKREVRALRNHEDHVARLYELLGYQVTSNVNVDGQQSDLICERWTPGAPKTVLYADAKSTTVGAKSYVSKSGVHDFIVSFESRKAVGGWTSGVLLSNKLFSQHAYAAAAGHHDIALKTVQDLREDL